MMAERGLAMIHTTILRWVQRYLPGFEKRWNRYARKQDSRGESMKRMSRCAANGSIYIAPLIESETPFDFRLSPKRDTATMKIFLRNAIKG